MIFKILLNEKYEELKERKSRNEGGT